MHIETKAKLVVQLLLKGDYYDELCPNNEDVWYTAEEVLKNPLLCRLLESSTIGNIKDKYIDFVVCRGNW